MAMKRRINVPSGKRSDLFERHAYLRQHMNKLHKDQVVANEQFAKLSYTDAIMMLVETDVTIACRMKGEQKLYMSDPRYYETLWNAFAMYVMPEHVHKTNDARVLFSTMLDIICDFADITQGDLFSSGLANEFANVGGFQRVRDSITERYETKFVFKEYVSIEQLYKGALRLCCLAIDCYSHDYLQGEHNLPYGPPAICVSTYLKQYGFTDVHSSGWIEERLYEDHPEQVYQSQYEPESFEFVQNTSEDTDAEGSVAAALSLHDEEPVMQDDYARSAREWLRPPLSQRSHSETVALSFGSENEPATIDRSDEPPFTISIDINRLLP